MRVHVSVAVPLAVREGETDGLMDGDLGLAVREGGDAVVLALGLGEGLRDLERVDVLVGMSVVVGVGVGLRLPGERVDVTEVVRVEVRVALDGVASVWV